MITEALLALLGLFMSWLSSLLPVGTIAFEGATGVGEWIGERIGPADQFLPLTETFQFLVIVLTVWSPAVLTYTLVKWIYRHLPVVGKG